MFQQAKEVAANEGAEITKTIFVNGSLEIPLAAKKLIMDKNNDCIVVLGAVVKGETAHDEVIVKTTANKMSELSLEFRKPIGFGIIGYDSDWDTADERAEEYAERAVKSAIELSEALKND